MSKHDRSCARNDCAHKDHRIFIEPHSIQRGEEMGTTGDEVPCTRDGCGLALRYHPARARGETRKHDHIASSVFAECDALKTVGGIKCTLPAGHQHWHQGGGKSWRLADAIAQGAGVCGTCDGVGCRQCEPDELPEPHPIQRGEEMGTTGEEDEESKGPAFYFASLAEAREVLGNALYPGLNGDSPPGTANSLWAFAHEAARRLTPAPSHPDPDAAVRAPLNKQGVPELGMITGAQGRCLDCRAVIGAGFDCRLCRAFRLGRDEGAREAEGLKGLIDRDKTGLALGLNKIQRMTKGFDWICEGRGPYEYDDDRYRMEVGSLIVQVLAVAREHLNASGELADEAFHPRAKETAQALADAIARRSQVPK